MEHRNVSIFNILGQIFHEFVKKIFHHIFSFFSINPWFPCSHRAHPARGLPYASKFLKNFLQKFFEILTHLVGLTLGSKPAEVGFDQWRRGGHRFLRGIIGFGRLMIGGRRTPIVRCGPSDPDLLGQVGGRLKMIGGELTFDGLQNNCKIDKLQFDGLKIIVKLTNWMDRLKTEVGTGLWPKFLGSTIKFHRNGPKRFSLAQEFLKNFVARNFEPDRKFPARFSPLLQNYPKILKNSIRYKYESVSEWGEG